jgi:hypothetical protein
VPPARAFHLELFDEGYSVDHAVERSPEMPSAGATLLRPTPDEDKSRALDSSSLSGTPMLHLP